MTLLLNKHLQKGTLLLLVLIAAACSGSPEKKAPLQKPEEFVAAPRYAALLAKVKNGIVGDWEITQVSFREVPGQTNSRALISRTSFPRGERLHIAIRSDHTVFVDTIQRGTWKLDVTDLLLKGKTITSEPPLFMNVRYRVGITRTCMYLTTSFYGSEDARHEVRYILVKRRGN